MTPWNNHGYDVAKIFGGKFSLISPVWLQVSLCRVAGGMVEFIYPSEVQSKSVFVKSLCVGGKFSLKFTLASDLLKFCTRFILILQLSLGLYFGGHFFISLEDNPPPPQEFPISLIVSIRGNFVSYDKMLWENL